MSIVNRRNAVVGFVTVTVLKSYAKNKAREAVPKVDPETKRPNKSLIALVATAAGVLAFWRVRSGSDDPPAAE